MAKIQKVEKKKKAGRGLLVFAGILAVLLAVTFISGYFNIFYAWGSKQNLEQVTIDAQLMDNGDLRITETWVLAMKNRGREYTNGYKSFSTGGYDGIEDLTVYDHDKDSTYTLLEDVKNPENGGYPANSCYITGNSHEYEVGWFFEPIKSGVRTFTFSYTMTNIATVYNDTAELYVGFIGRYFSIPIQNLDITLHLPTQSENPLVWLHSASNGIIAIADASTVTIQASNVNAQTMVEARVLFDENSLPASTKTEGIDWKQRTLEVERGFFNDSDAVRGYAAFIVVLSICLVSLSIFSLRFFARARRHKVEAPDYVREPPADISLGAARLLYLFYEKKASTAMNGDLISALVLSMAQKGWLTVEEVKRGKNGTVITPQADGRAPITKEEKPLWDIFTTLAQMHGGSFTMEQYAAYGRKEYTTVHCAMQNISVTMKADFNARHWVERSYFFKRPSTWIGFALLAPHLFSSWMMFTGFGFLLFCLTISGLIFLAQSLMHRRLTREGEQAYQNLLAFRKYLTDFTILDERAPKEVHLWQEYMIYATLLDCADTVRKSIPFPNVKVKDGNGPAAGSPPPAQPYRGSSGFSDFGHDSFSHGSSWSDRPASSNSFRTFSAMGDSLSRTFQSVRDTASTLSQPSSGSGGSGGGGGGSSSGGGGGGGSGGGGGVR